MQKHQNKLEIIKIISIKLRQCHRNYKVIYEIKQSISLKLNTFIKVTWYKTSSIYITCYLYYFFINVMIFVI